MFWILLVMIGCGLSSEGPAFVVTERELHVFVVTESDRPPAPPVPSESLPDPSDTKRSVVKLYTALPPPGKNRSWCAPCDQWKEEWAFWKRHRSGPQLSFDIQEIDVGKLKDEEWPIWNPEHLIPAYEWQDSKGVTRYKIGKWRPVDLDSSWRLTQKK